MINGWNCRRNLLKDCAEVFESCTRSNYDKSSQAVCSGVFQKVKTGILFFSLVFCVFNISCSSLPAGGQLSSPVFSIALLNSVSDVLDVETSVLSNKNAQAIQQKLCSYGNRSAIFEKIFHKSDEQLLPFSMDYVDRSATITWVDWHRGVESKVVIYFRFSRTGELSKLSIETIAIFHPDVDPSMGNITVPRSPR